MTATGPQIETAPPTLRQLNTAVLIAAGAAAAISIAAVLPAEYGVDPTGIGRVLGLTPMGERRVAQANGGKAPAGPVAGDAIATTPDGGRRVRIVLGPYAGREVKAAMKAGAELTYRWSTDGAPVEFEFHGEPDVPRTPGDYSSYAKGMKASAQGRFKAGFAGHHGWYWKNPTATPVVVTAIVKGAVESFAPIYAKGAAVAAPATDSVAGAAGSVETTRYATDLPLKTVMRAVFGHAAQEIWKRQGYVSDATGVHSLFPKDAEEWTLAENDAISLAEMTNILLLPGRRVDEQAWIDSVAGVRKSALTLAALTRKQDKDAYMEAGLHLNDACNACHARYAPGVE